MVEQWPPNTASALVTTVLPVLELRNYEHLNWASHCTRCWGDTTDPRASTE